MIANGVRQAARELLHELDGHRLEVCKVRSRDGWIRCVLAQNADWYQRLCAEFEVRRRRYPKYRTQIRRQHVRRALREIASGKNETLYAARVLPHCVKRAGENLMNRRRGA